jgi:hypothetical protein
MTKQREVGDTVRTPEGLPGTITAQRTWDDDNEEWMYDVTWHDGDTSEEIGDSFFLEDGVEPDGF